MQLYWVSFIIQLSILRTIRIRFGYWARELSRRKSYFFCLASAYPTICNCPAGKRPFKLQIQISIFFTRFHDLDGKLLDLNSKKYSAPACRATSHFNICASIFNQHYSPVYGLFCFPFKRTVKPLILTRLELKLATFISIGFVNLLTFFVVRPAMNDKMFIDSIKWNSNFALLANSFSSA